MSICCIEQNDAVSNGIVSIISRVVLCSNGSGNAGAVRVKH